MKPFTIKWSTIIYYLQSVFVGAMLAFCHISISDWQFWVTAGGVIILTGIYGELKVSENKKENE